MISYGRHYLDKRDIDGVVAVLKSSYLTQGEKSFILEKNLCKKFHTKSACVVSSGTAALHLVSKVLNWGAKDKIICTPITFVATANSIMYSNATPLFVDIDQNTFNLCPNKTEYELKKDKKKNIKAIIATDYAGNPCNWKDLRFLANKYNLHLVNDNCHAIGSIYNGHIGYAAKYADLVAHSYHPVKNITTGEGGAVISNNSSLINKIKVLRNHGLYKKNLHPFIPNPGKMLSLGYNYRLSDINCSLGITQLKKLDKFLKKRKKIANIYDKEFLGIKNLKTQFIKKQDKSAYHLYPILIDFKKIGKNKVELFKLFYKNKILPQVHYIPVYRHLFYKKKFNINYSNFINAENFYKNAISLPIYYSLKNYEIKKVVKVLKNFISE
jgi:dTDP-4-amino-4,6-dideoxygalactose transaminase